MKKVLVTGGAGLIGSHIVDNLIEKDYEVVVLDNLSNGKRIYVNPKATFYKADITTQEIAEIFKEEKPEIVIHCAAQIMLRKSIEEPLEDAKINILGTINVLENCKKNHVKKFIYTSTGGARVGEPNYLPVDEKHPINPISPYGISKHTAEHYVEMYSKLNNIDYLIFCFGNVYGPRDNYKGRRIIPIFAYQILNNETPNIFGDGDQTRDYIYVKDLASFIANNVEKSPKTKLFHLANGTPTSVNEIFEKLKNVSGFQNNANHVEPIKGEVRDIVLDTTLVKNELGWQPSTTLDQGIKETFDWYKNNIKNL